MELQAIFQGRVQGVGFRWTVLDLAEKLGLRGSVQNLPNGTVEVYAYGSQEELKRFLEALKQNPGSARIDSIKETYRKSEKSFPNFRIL